MTHTAKRSACMSVRCRMLLLLSAAATACSSGPGKSPAPQPNVVVHRPLPLSPAARQPALPPWCLPTCSAGLTAERQKQLQPWTGPTPPASPASASTLRQ